MKSLLLTTFPDPERVKFARYRVNGQGELRRKGIALRVLKRVFRMMTSKRGHPEFTLAVAALVVIGGETVQRSLVRRFLSPGVQGISICPDKTSKFIFELVTPRLKGKGKTRMVRMLEGMVAQALKDFKALAGFPEHSAQASCFEISDEVIEAASSGECREYLEINRRSCPHLLSGDLQPFIEVVAGRFPDEVEAIKDALKATSSREHLAAISLTGEADNLSITLVNTAGSRVTMKARRFVQMMMTPGEPVQLGEFPDPRRYREPEVIFNNCREGVVHGQFSVGHGCIEVICVDPNKTGVNALYDRASLAIDVDYALCVALVLYRLHSDEERVSRLLQKLSTKAVDETHRQLFTLR